MCSESFFGAINLFDIATYTHRINIVVPNHSHRENGKYIFPAGLYHGVNSIAINHK